MVYSDEMTVGLEIKPLVFNSEDWDLVGEGKCHVN